jgi:hypothetical protein
MAVAHQLADVVIDADVMATLETAVAERDRALVMLRDVMMTLATSCPSDQHRALYNDAYALIAEHGLPLDPKTAERYALAYAAWEASKR